MLSDHLTRTLHRDSLCTGNTLCLTRLRKDRERHPVGRDSVAFPADCCSGCYPLSRRTRQNTLRTVCQYSSVNITILILPLVQSLFLQGRREMLNLSCVAVDRANPIISALLCVGNPASHLQGITIQSIYTLTHIQPVGGNILSFYRAI